MRLFHFSNGSRPDLPSFADYVYKYHEMTHSGIGANLAWVNPDHPEYFTVERATEGIQALEQYANESITAYLAIEYWANQSTIPGDWVTNDGESTLPKDILARVTKPTFYWMMTSERVEITDATDH